MAYDLENTFPNTYNNRAGSSSSAILAKYPYLCSRQALFKSIDDSGVAGDSQRNPNGYTVREITDKICEYWDDIMYVYYNSTVGDVSPRAWEKVINNYRWDQKEFWQNSETSFICFHRTSHSSSLTAAQVIADTDFVIQSGASYQYNTKEYIQKPFLAFDYNAQYTDSFGNFYTINQDDFGVELDIDGSGKVTGVTSGGTTDDPTSGSSTTNKRGLLHIYDFNFYHDDLNVNGSNFSINAAYSGHDVIDTSTKWYDLRVAKFDVTISSGVVTAVSPASRNDGDGTGVTGGWGYDTQHDYLELYFVRDVDADSNDVMPRVLIRTNLSQSGYSGNKATVDITNDDTEFYPGFGLEADDITSAYAFYAGTKGHAVSPSVDTTDEWYEVNIPRDILPNKVRVLHERPVINSTTRSLKTKTVGTGAHRLAWEFEYPPMTSDEVSPFIDFFEKSKGGSQEVQIWIPSTVMYHTGKWGSGKTAFSPSVLVRDGNLGSSYITLDGHEPGTSDTIPSGTYTNLDNKTYRLFNNSGNADQYGRVSYRIEPPLLKNATNNRVETNPNGYPILRDFYLIKARVVDDVFDYTVDAAGLYRIRFKFAEAL